MVARHVRDVDAAGSNPVISTKIAVSTFVVTAIFFVFDSKESNLMEVLALVLKAIKSTRFCWLFVTKDMFFIYAL